MSFVVAYALAGAGTLLVVLWVMLYLRYSSQYDVMIAAIDNKQFFLPEIFFIGFGFMDMFKVNLKTEAGRKKEKKIAEIYGEKYAEYYHNCIVGGQITYALTVAPLGLFIGAMTNDMTFAILVVAAAAALIVYLDMEVSSAVERKHDEILSDYPEILSKLTLLVNAGMVIREAWTKVAYTCDRAMYKEMQLTSEEMNNGVSELDALHNFAQRCSVKEILKFTSILSQNIQNANQHSGGPWAQPRCECGSQRPPQPDSCALPGQTSQASLWEPAHVCVPVIPPSNPAPASGNGFR